MFLGISENFQEKTSVGVSFLTLNTLVPGGNKKCHVLEKTLQLNETPMKFLRILFNKIPLLPTFEHTFCPRHIA